MKLLGKRLIFGLAAAAVAVACSNGHEGTTGPSSTGPSVGPASDGIGEVGMSLTLPGGEHYSRLDYKLANATNTLTGHYDITQTNTLSFTIGSVPAGSGYGLSLTTTSDDGAFTCSFPAVDAMVTSNITVVNRTTTVVNVNMQCVNNQGLDSGSVLIGASTSQCPVWNTIVANPVNITLDAGQNVNDAGAAGGVFMPGGPAMAAIQDGQQLVLVGSATAPNPAALAFTWTVSGTGASVSSAAGQRDPNSTDAGTTNQTIFTCPAAPSATQTFTVTMTLNDGSDAAGCDAAFTTATVQVQCSNPAPCGGSPTAPAGTASGLQNVCDTNGTTTLAPPLGGTYPYVSTTTVDPSGLVCCAPICGGVGAVATPPNSTGTCTTGANDGTGCCASLQPCTATGQANCVACTGSTGGVCTHDQQFFVQKDITLGKVTAPVAPTGTYPAASCYACLLTNGCVDSPSRHVSKVQCDDFTGNFMNGTASVPAASTCFKVVQDLFNGTGGNNSCLFGQPNGTSTIGNDTFCYCGAGGYGTGANQGLANCQNASASAVNGTDEVDEVAGFSSTTPGTNLGNYNSDPTEPSAVANALAECARGSSATSVATELCPVCLQ
jgi:hypothetical protein